MAFWTSEKLKERAEEEALITPYYDNRVKHGAYELSLGNEAFVTSDGNRKKHVLGDGEHLIIPSGQLALLITKEEIHVPPDTIGFISIKAGIKFSGLVNVSGFHVDPGFSGKLKFSVYNAGSRDTILSNGQNVFLIWFSDLDRKTSDTYKGDHANQKEISSQDVMKLQGEVHSPAALDKRLTSLEHSVSTIKWIAISLLLASITGAAGFFIKFAMDVWRPSIPHSIEKDRSQEDPGRKNASVHSPNDRQAGGRTATGQESVTETSPQPLSTSSTAASMQSNKGMDTKKVKASRESPKNISPEPQGGAVEKKSVKLRDDGKQIK